MFSKDQIIDGWDVLITGASGRGAEVFENTKNLLKASKAPNVTVDHQKLCPGGALASLFGDKRPFMIIANTSNRYLRPFRMYINTREYGENLQVSWFLVHQAGGWQKLMRFLLYIPILNLLVLPICIVGKFNVSKEADILNLSIFDEQDLRAYVTNAHHRLLDAVDKMMLDMQLDPSQIRRHSRGFLGIS